MGDLRQRPAVRRLESRPIECAVGSGRPAFTPRFTRVLTVASDRYRRVAIPLLVSSFLTSPSGITIGRGITRPAGSMVHRSGNNRLDVTSCPLDLTARRVGLGIGRPHRESQEGTSRLSSPYASWLLHMVIRGFHTVSRAWLQGVRSLRGCPGRRTSTRPRGGGRVEYQTEQDRHWHRNRSRRAGSGVRPQYGDRQRRDHAHVLGDIVIVRGGHDSGQRRVGEQCSHCLSGTVRFA